jgi:hypothetical protein
MSVAKSKRNQIPMWGRADTLNHMGILIQKHE